MCDAHRLCFASLLPSHRLPLTRLRLRTFGGLSIETGSGGEDSSLAPRHLALLSVVAAAEPRGITRDRIVGILWADTGEEQARHTLSQNLYFLRRETGTDLVTGTTRLRLDSSLSSDVADFRLALDGGDLARAAALYAGPFLEGFYLPGAPEFERWVEDERSRLKGAAATALETLADRAVAMGTINDSIAWWRRLRELDPFSARYAAGLIRALISADDRVAALRFAQSYQAELRRELDADLDPGISELLATLRVRPASAPIDATSRAVQSTAPSNPDPTASAIPPADTRQPSRRRLTTRTQALLVAGLTIAILGWWRLTRSAHSGDVPFLAVGSIRARDSVGLGPILRDMLATNLARVRGLQVLANSRLIEMAPRGADSVPSATTDAARRAGAEQIIEGELEARSGGLVLSLRRVELRSGLLIQGYTVTAADRYAVIDSATGAIARDFKLSPPGDAVMSVRTASPAAYALYEEGLRAFHMNDAAGAYRLMIAALEHDSTFAMAAHYSALAARGLGREAEADRAIEIAEQLASRATDRERLLILAEAAGRKAPIAEYLRTAKELTERYPGDAEGQMLLGSAQFTAGDWWASVAAYRRAFEIDSAAGVIRGPFCRVCSVLIAMSHSYLWGDSAAAAERTGRRLVAMFPEEGLAWGSLIEPLLRQNRWVDAEAAMARAGGLSLTKGEFGPLLDRGLIRSGRFAELDLKLWSSVANSPGSRGETGWLLGISFRNQGRLREARELAEHGVVPGTSIQIPGPPDPTSIAIVLFDFGQPRESARMFLQRAEADRAGTDPPGLKARILAWHLTLAGTGFAAAGDTVTVRQLADSVERIGALSRFGRDGRLHYFLRGLLYQRQGRHSDAVDSFRRSLFSLTDGYTRTNLEMARSLMALRRYLEAIAILQPALRGGIDGSNAYVTQTELHEALAQAFELAGRSDSATTHYSAVEAAWRGADPVLRQRYELARSKAGVKTP